MWISTDNSRRARGFTLLEVVVALVILSLAMAGFLRLFSTGLRSLDAAEHRTMAALHAESLLAEIGVTGPLEDGVQEGEFERGYWWRTEVRPYADEQTAEAGESAVAAYSVRVTVGWSEDHSGGFSLETMRLAREPF